MNEDYFVCCIKCKHFKFDISQDPVASCEFEDDCDIWDFDCSRSFSDRPHYISNEQNKYVKYNGKNVDEFRRIPEKSIYNRNYYETFNGDVLFAYGDDDNYTAYYLNGECEQFAESFASQGDTIFVFKEG